MSAFELKGERAAKLNTVSSANVMAIINDRVQRQAHIRDLIELDQIMSAAEKAPPLIKERLPPSPTGKVPA